MTLPQEWFTAGDFTCIVCGGSNAKEANGRWLYTEGYRTIGKFCGKECLKRFEGMDAVSQAACIVGKEAKRLVALRELEPEVTGVWFRGPSYGWHGMISMGWFYRAPAS